jgi:hypothetical protein
MTGAFAAELPERLDVVDGDRQRFALAGGVLNPLDNTNRSRFGQFGSAGS